MDTKPSALFVDFENVFYSLKHGESLGRDPALSASMDILGELRRRLRDEGHALVVERCYADWEQLPASAQRQLQIAGVLPRFADSRVDKNTADIELSLDILSNILTRPELRHVVLVGGDRDYLPILRRLKEQHLGLHVCSLKACLSGDVREFVSNYPQATVIELDVLFEPAKYRPQPPGARAAPVSRPDNARTVLAPQTFDPDAISEWHERYLAVMLKFMRDNKFKEIHLAPFFRWLQAEKVFELVSVQEQRKILDELKAMHAIVLEERDTGQGYAFSVVQLDWTHPLVQKLNET
jgi:hypothetical protein